MTFLYTPLSGPLAGHPCTVQAINDFHAEMVILDLTRHAPSSSELVAVRLGRVPVPEIGELIEQLKSNAPKVGG